MSYQNRPRNRLTGGGLALAAGLAIGLAIPAAADDGVWSMPYSGASAQNGTLFKVKTTGTGKAGWFEISNALNGSYALHAITNGTSRAGHFEISNASNGAAALFARTNGTGYGGIFELTRATNANPAVWGYTIGTGRAGVFEISNAANANPALEGKSNGTGPGVQGKYIGLPSTSGYLGSSSYGAYGVYNAGNYGFLGSATYGAYGKHNTSGNFGYLATTSVGAWGQHNSSGNHGYLGSDAYGVFGRADAAADYAGYFVGRVHVAGTLSKSAGSFKIDHPLDPANKYLSHSFVESPDMKNLYDGVVALDAQGEASVKLPEWFEELNRDFRYQLTCIGGFAPVYVAEEIQDNAFRIAGGRPGLKVSWQVTGTRQDPYAEEHRIPVEEEKTAEERGKFLHPELYGQPGELGTSRVREVRAPEVRSKMSR